MFSDILETEVDNVEKTEIEYTNIETTATTNNKFEERNLLDYNPDDTSDDYFPDNSYYYAKVQAEINRKNEIEKKAMENIQQNLVNFHSNSKLS